MMSQQESSPGSRNPANPRGFKWSHEEVTMLVSLYNRASLEHSLNGTCRDQWVYEDIAGQLSSQGFDRNHRQVRDKVNNMRGHYKKIIEKLCIGNRLTVSEQQVKDMLDPVFGLSRNVLRLQSQSQPLPSPSQPARLSPSSRSRLSSSSGSGGHIVVEEDFDADEPPVHIPNSKTYRPMPFLTSGRIPVVVARSSHVVKEEEPHDEGYGPSSGDTERSDTIISVITSQRGPGDCSTGSSGRKRHAAAASSSADTNHSFLVNAQKRAKLNDISQNLAENALRSTSSRELPQNQPSVTLPVSHGATEQHTRETFDLSASAANSGTVNASEIIHMFREMEEKRFRHEVQLERMRLEHETKLAVQLEKLRAESCLRIVEIVMDALAQRPNPVGGLTLPAHRASNGASTQHDPPTSALANGHKEDTVSSRTEGSNGVDGYEQQLQQRYY